jgi:hypothetical protein
LRSADETRDGQTEEWINEMRERPYFDGWALIAFALLAGLTCAASAAPVAVVTDVQGRSVLQGTGAARPLVMLTEIDGDAQV